MGSSPHFREGLTTWDDITRFQIFYIYDSRATFPLDVLRIDLIAILPSGIGIWVSKFLRQGIHAILKGSDSYIAWNGGVLPTEISGNNTLGSEGERTAIFPFPTREMPAPTFSLLAHENTLAVGLIYYYF